MRSAQIPVPPVLRLLPLVALAFLAAACSGSGAEAAAEAVATSDDIVFDDPDDGPATTSSDDAEGTAGDPALTADEAALEFSQCMRDGGLDFPDIGVDAEGNPELRGAFVDAGLDPRSDEFRTMLETCGPILQQAGFGGGGRAQLADNPEFQDALVEFSECLRDRGYDVGDIQFGAGPGGQGQAPADGDAAGEQGPRGQGQGQGGFGDRSARLAQALGLDVDDPQVESDIDECGVVLDTALAAAGIAGAGQ